MRLKNLKILFRYAFFIFAIFNLAGCSTVKYTQMKELEPLKEAIKIQSPQGTLRIGETLTYQAHWSGVPVGQLVTKVEGIEYINGRPCYHLVVTAKSNRWLSTFYKIDDEFHSFMDTEKFCTRRLKKFQNEGRFKSEEVINFDQDSQKATYESIKNKTVKEFAIPPLVQDEVTSFFYCRLKDLDVSRPVNFFVTLNEKNYSIEAKIIESGIIEIKNLSKWDVVVFSPSIKLGDETISKAKILFWVSTGPERLPIMLKARTPVLGSVNLVLSDKK